jgi:hypothetical protein
MNPNYSNVLAAMEGYIEVAGHLAAAIQSGQGALVRMDLAAFERLTAEQERLCGQLKALQASADHPFPRPESAIESGSSSQEQSDFYQQRAVLAQRCRALQERIRHLNRVNQLFLNRVRQSFELLLRLAMPMEPTYSAPPAARQFAGWAAGKE